MEEIEATEESAEGEPEQPEEEDGHTFNNPLDNNDFGDSNTLSEDGRREGWDRGDELIGGRETDSEDGAAIGREEPSEEEHEDGDAITRAFEIEEEDMKAEDAIGIGGGEDIERLSVSDLRGRASE